MMHSQLLLLSEQGLADWKGVKWNALGVFKAADIRMILGVSGTIKETLKLFESGESQ